MARFFEKLDAAAQARESMLCVGLDPDPAKLPKCLGRGAQAVLAFNRAIIAATAPYVCAFKPNAAFFEALGGAGWRVLRQTIASVPGDIPVILDAKRGDIGNTSLMYARAAFQKLGADAITLSPYMGDDSVLPFLAQEGRGAFILCRTSNPGGADFQNLKLTGGAPLYLEVARKVALWNRVYGNAGLVVGATAPEELAAVRAKIGPEMPILLPGVGAQGGDPEVALPAGLGSAPASLLVNVSRSVLYASAGEDFAAAAAREADRLRVQLNEIRARLP